MTAQQFVVRLWDGFDGEWMDVHGPCAREEAEQVCGDLNEQRTGGPGTGRREGSFDDIDYYRVFSSDELMWYGDGHQLR